MEMKACPFCKNDRMFEITSVQHSEKARPYGYRYTGSVTCLSCFASTKSHGFEKTAEAAEKAAIKAWNRRA